MKNRRTFVLALTSGLVAAAVIITPVIAEELLGNVLSVDVAGKKLTIVEKGTDKEVVVTTTDSTEIVTGKGDTIDLEKIARGVNKAKEAGKKGAMAKVTHEKGVASKIIFGLAKKKDAN